MTTPARDEGQLGLWPMAAPADPKRPRVRTKPAFATRPAAILDERHLWDIDELAEFLGIKKQTFYKWRKTDYGPPPIKIGKHLRWIPATVVAWAKEQEIRAG
ncbi:MAG: helix-turn-helix domain-containing protein [Nocardioides sp.]|uniref:helix-turn-helix transcriptional regulator n=1 Tax=Nocardioides sp. TaxID=35761 RepID=UPI0039E2E1F1